MTYLPGLLFRLLPICEVWSLAPCRDAFNASAPVLMSVNSRRFARSSLATAALMFHVLPKQLDLTAVYVVLGLLP